MNKTLTVYKASAGSGKTFTLATAYIKLLIENPQSYRSILAVTFTNKATEEMKQRILSQLYGIWKHLPSSRKYLEEVTGSLGIDEETASARAGIALRNLIHNYSYFRVETIDSFFQAVLRNLARELDLTANLRIELNDTQVEEQAVDLLIEQLRKDDLMLKWLIEYIEQNIEEDKSWNVIGQIKQFGKTIFHDYYKKESESLNKILGEKDFFPKYVKELERIRRQAARQMNQYADEFFDILEQNGLDADMLAGKKRGISSYFNKLKGNDYSDKTCYNTVVEKCLNDAGEWATKTSKQRALIMSLAETTLIPLLQEAERNRPAAWRQYLSADVTLRHLNQVRLLSSIEAKVRSLNEEANRFLLSDTQQFLHDLIDESDSPFIFEKIGTQLEHIMIDEFQDTSTVQWQNFKVLLEETMSRESDAKGHDLIRNLIVGDVKQSIYRWRNGDWRLLNGIQQQFAHAGARIDIKSLGTNYRSSKNIIDFNNAFFQQAAQLEYEAESDINPSEAPELQQAYADVCQQVPGHKTAKGMVRITLLNKADYEEQMMEQLGRQVDELLADGINMEDMAILVRSNRNIPVIAEYFMQTRPHIHLVSDEAFRLNASLAVNTLISSMRMLATPTDMLAKANVEEAYTFITGEPMPEITEEERLQLLNMPLTDMTEKLFGRLQLAKLHNQSAYISAFNDQLALFTENNGTDLHGFLRQWDENICKKTIQSDEINGIRLISIHKSKGLEFDHVIIPFCDWKLELGNTLWCKPQEAPYNLMPLVPIDYSSKLKDTIYAEDYGHEHLQNCVDNLNLLYVAFTRAGKNLFVIGKKDAKGTRSALIQEVIGKMSLPETRLDEGDEEQPMIFEYGSLYTETAPSIIEEERNVFLSPTDTIHIDIHTHDSTAVFRQSNRSRDFVKSEEADDEEEGHRNQYIKMGNVMHRLFSKIRTVDDIPQVLKELEFEGILYDENISAECIRSMLEKRLSHPKVQEWFSDRWQLFNECSILFVNEHGMLQERRPDRVMTNGEHTVVVDFKFGKAKPEYQEQVREYMQLLSAMGHRQVSGFLWYVYNNQIEEVRA